MEDLSLILFDHPFDTSISRNRDLFLYRGLPDCTFSLVTSLQRVCKHKKKELELDILDNFAKTPSWLVPPSADPSGEK